MTNKIDINLQTSGTLESDRVEGGPGGSPQFEEDASDASILRHLDGHTTIGAEDGDDESGPDAYVVVNTSGVNGSTQLGAWDTGDASASVSALTNDGAGLLGLNSSDTIIAIAQFLILNPVYITMPNLPTSDPANPGQLWLDGTTLRVSV